MKKIRNSNEMRRRILVVDDEYVNREMLGYILSRDYDVLYAQNGREAIEVIKENSQQLSLVMLDLLMPEMNGLEVIEKLQADEELKRIPIIVLTSEESAEVTSLQLGAIDFIKKPYNMPEIILARVLRIIELSEDRLFIQSTERDSLTGLYTKDFFFQHLKRIHRYRLDKDMDALVLNIDHFHLVNELYGREYGDQVLKLIANMIKQFLDEVGGMGCRTEADTFFIYCAHQEDYNVVLNRILDALSEISKTPRIRLRLGVYLKNEEEQEEIDFERRFDRANLACNRIRGNYTQSIAFYDMDIHKSSIYSERLINDIHEAIDQKQLMVFFQPKYGIQGDKPKLRSAEALIRWKHPELGMISPGAFIPLFEKNGLIQLLDNYVWDGAAEKIRAWKDKYGVTVPVSVNVSRIDIYDPNLENKLFDILKKYDLTTNDMMLEITESAYADDSAQLIEVVQSLREHGFKIEMDDFGSGYSSLNMLSTLPIDVLKMDMKFVRNMQEDKKSFRLIELIMDIAEYMSVPVVAEGVEYEEQYQLLKDAGCEVIQGYYFSKPVPADEFEQFIVKEK